MQSLDALPEHVKHEFDKGQGVQTPLLTNSVERHGTLLEPDCVAATHWVELELDVNPDLHVKHVPVKSPLSHSAHPMPQTTLYC